MKSKKAGASEEGEDYIHFKTYSNVIMTLSDRPKDRKSLVIFPFEKKIDKKSVDRFVFIYIVVIMVTGHGIPVMYPLTGGISLIY